MNSISRRSHSVRVSAIFLFLLAVVQPTWAVPQYNLVDLGTLGGVSAQAGGINQNGDVAGYSQTPGSVKHAALWDSSGVVMDLGVPPGFTVGEARAVNDWGQVAGVGSKDPQALGAFRWENGVWTELAVLAGRSEAIAEDINGAGEIVGWSFTLGQNDSRGILWQAGAVRDLGTLGGLGGATQAFAINEAGQIVGRSQKNPNGPFNDRANRAFIWDYGVMTDLDVLPGEDESGAFGVNEVGEVVGESWHLTSGTFFQASRATLWPEGGGVVDLGLTPAGLPGPCASDFPFWTSNTALAANNNGEVVGYARCVASGGAKAAFLWQDGVNYNLNELILAGPDLDLINAQDINDAGQIVGVAVDANNRLRAFLLEPVTPCASDWICDDGLFCNGAEMCVSSVCQAGGDPCPGQVCDEGADTCAPRTCDNNGACDLGEDCDSCPNDCVGSAGGSAVCGDGVCQPGSGEDCVSCESDCRGRQSGNPSGRYCCGADVDCSDARCNMDTWVCNDAPPAPYCCGDAMCDPGEDQNNCPLDCGAPPPGNQPPRQRGQRR